MAAPRRALEPAQIVERGADVAHALPVALDELEHELGDRGLVAGAQQVGDAMADHAPRPGRGVQGQGVGREPEHALRVGVLHLADSRCSCRRRAASEGARGRKGSRICARWSASMASLTGMSSDSKSARRTDGGMSPPASRRRARRARSSGGIATMRSSQSSAVDARLLLERRSAARVDAVGHLQAVAGRPGVQQLQREQRIAPAARGGRLTAGGFERKRGEQELFGVGRRSAAVARSRGRRRAWRSASSRASASASTARLRCARSRPAACAASAS